MRPLNRLEKTIAVLIAVCFLTVTLAHLYRAIRISGYSEGYKDAVLETIRIHDHD